MNSLTKIARDFKDDLDGYYREIQKMGGSSHVFYDNELNSWIVTGYEECARLLSGDSLAKSRISLGNESGPEDLVNCAQGILDAQMMFSDGGQPHTAERRKFWNRLLMSLEQPTFLPESIEVIAGQAIDALSLDMLLDLYSVLLQPYVSRVVSSRLGISEVERRSLLPLINQYVALLDGKTTDRVSVAKSLYAIIALYSKLAPRAQNLPTNAQCPHVNTSDLILTLVAGHESAAYLMGTALLHMQLSGVSLLNLDDSSLMRILWEAARIDSPVQMIGRRSRRNLTIGEHAIPDGQSVLLHVGAACRDPRTYDFPDQFDARRSGPALLIFGVGQNKCIGHNLAFEQSLVFFRTLINREISIVLDTATVSRTFALAGRSFLSLQGYVTGNSA